MTIDKRKLYILSSALVPAFLLVCFIGNPAARRFTLTAVVAAAVAAVFLLIQKRSALSIHKKQLLWVLPTFAALGVMLLYLLGLRFGYYRVTVNGETLLYKVLPFGLTIVGSELIRERLLMQKNRTVNILSFCAFILCEIAMLYEWFSVETFSVFRNFFASTVFPCIASGVLYHFISKRYGALPVIAYRLIITLYSILIPIYPSVPVSLLCFLKILFPILAVFFIGTLYERKKKSFSRKKSRVQVVLTAIIILLMTGVMMLISCRFRFGLLVVGSESMTGAIDKGDAIIYEEYNGQIIEDGQILVFEKNKSVYIHRVEKIENIDGQIRYTTKGDRNDSSDTGYITRDNIIGITDLKIKYIGYPTLWVRDLFRK